MTMAFNNYMYPAGYPSAVYPQFQQPQAQPQTQPSTDLKWVQGEAAAKSYSIAPNTSVTLWDQEAQTIYIKSADMTGMQSMKILDYTIRDSTPQNKPGLAESDYALKEDVEYLKEQISVLRAKFDDAEGKESKK